MEGKQTQGGLTPERTARPSLLWPSQNARCPTTCAPARPRSRPRGCGSCWPEHGTTLCACPGPPATSRSSAPSSPGAGAEARPPLPPRAQVPSGPRHGPTCESGPAGGQQQHQQRRPQHRSHAGAAARPDSPSMGGGRAAAQPWGTAGSVTAPGRAPRPLSRDGLRPPPLLPALLTAQPLRRPAPSPGAQAWERSFAQLSRPSVCFGWDLPPFGLQLLSVVHPLHTL